MSKIKSILAFVALMLCGGAWAEKSISINFSQSGNDYPALSGDQTTVIGDIAENSWNTTTQNGGAANGTASESSGGCTISTLKVVSDGTVQDDSTKSVRFGVSGMANVWFANGNNSLSGSYLYTGLCHKNGNNGQCDIWFTNSGTDFATYDVIVYMTAVDISNSYTMPATFSAIQINNQWYKGDSSASSTTKTVICESTDTWGSTPVSSMQLGVNAIRVNGLSGTLHIQKAGQYDCGIAAIQIVDRTPTTPVLLLNLGTSESVAGWTNKTQSDGAKLPKDGKFTDASGVGFLAAVVSGDGGNFSTNNECNTNFDTGTYVDILGETHSTITAEVKASLGLPESTTFDSTVYKTGLLNGGYSGHTGTISGLTPGQPYVVYLGFGRKGNDVTYFKMEASGFGKAESIAYVSTVARSGSNATAKASEYTEYSVGSQIGTGSVEGLMIVRMANITPNSDGNIVFYMPGGRAGMNFIAVAKSTLVAKVDGKACSSFTEALSKAIEIGNAQAPAVVALMADVADNFEVPANVTVDANGFALTGTITGAGRVVFNTMPSAAQQTNFKDSTKWTGTVELRDYEDASDSHKICNFNLLGNARSTVCLNGVKSTMYTTDNSTGNYPMITLGTLEIGPKGWSSIAGLNYSNNSPRYNVNLTGTGTITVLTGGTGTINFIGDHSGFKGSINASNGSKGVILSPAGASKVADTNTGAQIIIGANQTIEIAEGQTFTATGGIKIRGNIKGSGTLDGPVTFENTSGIDPSSGTPQLASGRVCYFGSTINIIGEQETGTSLLTGVGSEPTGLAYVSVSVNGTTKVGAVLTYEDRTIKYSYQEAAYWTPNSECVDTNRIFDWSAENAWKDKTNQDATWSVGADDVDKPDVVIDASVIKGVKITGQVYVGNITVVGTLADVESFQFHNHLQVVDNDHEVNPEGEGHDCLHATSISLTGLSGTVGMKVPIMGEIAFGSTTRLVFETGTDDEPSSAYGYTFVDRGGAIIVEGAGKFVVPSSMYGTPFAPASGAKLVYRAAGTVSGTISGAGSVIKDDDTTVTFSGTNTFTGGTIVEAGTLKLGSPRCLGAQGAAVTVKPNAILDVNGTQNHGIVLTLAGGTVKNTGGGVSTGNVQFRSISLSADSVIDIDYSTGIVNNNHVETTLQLNTHKLIKKGDGTFLITHVNTSNGTIEIQAGEIKVEQGYNCNFTDVAFTVPSTAAQDIVVQNGTSTSAGNGTVFKAAERTGGETIYIKTAAGTYQLASGNAATLKTGDIIVFENSIYATGGDRWGTAPSFSAKFAGHKVIVNISMNIRGGLSANQEVEVNDTCYLYGGMADGATVAGTGTLYVGYDTSTFGNVSISCTKFGLQNNGSTYTAFISGAVDASQVTTIELGGNDDHFKLATEDATLKVPSKLSDGKVISGVNDKTVDFDPVTKTYSLIDLIETAQTWTMGDVIFDGDFHGVAWGANGVGTKTVNGVEYTITLNGHEIVKDGDKSYILIKENANGLGVTVTRNTASSATGETVVMRYSDYPAYDSETPIRVPMTLQCNKGGAYINIAEIFAADEDGTIKAGWADFFNGIQTSTGTPSKFSFEDGTLAMTYGKYNSNSGIYAFQKTDGDWNNVFSKNASGDGTDNMIGFALGGLYQAHVSNSNTSQGDGATTTVGMKIHAVAVTYSPITSATDSKITKPIFSDDDLVYSAFLTKTAVDTGLVVDSLDDLLDYHYYGTMDGGNIAGNDVLSRGFHVTKDEENDCVTFQMQVRQNQGSGNDHVKAVKVKMTLNSNNHVLIEGVSAGHISNQYLGTSITSWTDTLVTDARTAGYGVNKVIATKKPMPFVSVGFDGDTWTSSMVAKDYASGRVTGNFMQENGTAESSNFETVRESATDKAVKISSTVRPSYKDDANITFAKAVKNAESWTVQVVAKMASQTGNRLALWGIGDTSYQGSANEERGVALLLGTDGLPKFVKYGQRTTTDIAVCTEGESLCDRRYHVYTVVCDKDAAADRYVVYVDGEKVAASGDATLTAIPTSNQYFEIGTVRGGANELHNSQTTPTAIAIGSYFDDAAAWNVALTADEVKANAKKFPVWPNYSPADWQGEDGADIGTGANWGIDSDFNPAMTQGVFPTTSSIKEVAISSDTTFGALEINGAYKFTGSGVVTVNLLSFGANGSLRLENGVTLNFVSGLNPSYLANITFAGGQITAKEVPHFTQAENLTIDPTAYTTPGGHKLISWTDFMKTGEDGYGMPKLNTNALNPAAVLANHKNTISELDWGNGSKARLLGLVGEIFLEVRSAEQLARKPIRILPLGDSITEGFNGSGNCANYRTQLAAKLSMAGYNVQMLGYHFVRSFMPSGEWAPIEWQYHAGVSAQRVWTQRPTSNGVEYNNRAGDMEAIEQTLESCGGTPDVVLVKLGTNDIGNGDPANHIFQGLKSILDYIHEKLPESKVVVTTAIKYGTNNGIRQTYNGLIRDAFKTGGTFAGSDYSWLYFVDQCVKVGDGTEEGSFNDAQGRLIFYTDSTHPDWAGHDLMSDGWYEKIITIIGKDDGTDEPAKTACKLGAKANVPAEYLEGFTRYRQLDIAEVAAYPQSEFTGYSWSSEKTVTDITNVGYFMELVRKDTGSHKYVWVDMANFGDDTVQSFGLPTTATHQQVVNNLHVYSNMDSIHNVAADDNSVKGYIEFSPYNSTPATSSVTGAPTNLWDAMDWNDTFATSGAGRGAMQVHRIKKDGDALWNGGEVLFAYNNWGSANTTAGSDIGEVGIGNFCQHYVADTARNGNAPISNTVAPGTGVGLNNNWISVDYTGTRVSPVGDCVNAKAYEVRKIEIWVKGTVSGESPSEEETVVITTVPEAGVEIEPGDDVKVPTATESEKIKVVYNGVDLAKAEGERPQYVNVTINESTGAVELDTTEDAKPTVTAMAATTENESDVVSFTITPIPGLFYSVVAADGPSDSDFAEVQTTGTQATTGDETTLKANVDLTGQKKVKYFRVRVKATK